MALRLGTQTGSLTNHLYSRMTKGQPDPVVGMGVTLLAWTDRYAGTIVLIGPKIIAVQLDRAERLDRNGLSEDQHYRYSADPAGAIYSFRKSKSGAWEEVCLNRSTNRWVKTGGYGLRLGERDAYRDPCF